MSSNVFPSDAFQSFQVEAFQSALEAMASNESSANSNSSSLSSSFVPGPAKFPADMLGFTASCAFAIAIIGAFGNLLTIFALSLCKKLRTSATAFVINLAVIELMFCVFILPMSGAQYAYLQHNSESLLSDADCIFFASARYTLTQSEVQTILAIALTRAVAAGFPNLYRRIDNATVTGIYIAIIWLYSFGIRVPIIVGAFGEYKFNNGTMECDMGSDPMSRYARIILTLSEGIVPVLVILLLYVFIFVMVKKSSKRVARGSHTSKSSFSSSTGASSASEETTVDQGARKPSITSIKRMLSESSIKTKFLRRTSSTYLSTNRRDMKIARTIFIIFMMVLICSFPVAIAHILHWEYTHPRLFLAIHILYWVQYCLNMFVYVLTTRQYRKAYIEFVARLFPSFERHKNFVFFWEKQSIAVKPQGPQNSSFKSRKDSCSQDPAAEQPKEYKPVPDSFPHTGPGRLSAIVEVNSSSCVSNDDVFLEDPKNADPSAAGNEQQPLQRFKEHEEDGSAEEKQQWITQNGQTLSTPQEKDVV